jgi:hypothetical protein
MSNETKKKKVTTIRYDRTDNPAFLFTATASLKNEWKLLNYPVEKVEGGWTTQVPKDRIGFRPDWNQTKAANAERNLLTRLRKFHLTREQFFALSAKQNQQCAICTISSQKLHIDHDHSTGMVRGLLCNRCNSRLAALDFVRTHTDWVHAASIYCEHPPFTFDKEDEHAEAVTRDTDGARDDSTLG